MQLQCAQKPDRLCKVLKSIIVLHGKNIDSDLLMKTTMCSKTSLTMHGAQVNSDDDFGGDDDDENIVMIDELD